MIADQYSPRQILKGRGKGSAPYRINARAASTLIRADWPSRGSMSKYFEIPICRGNWCYRWNCRGFSRVKGELGGGTGGTGRVVSTTGSTSW